MDFAVLLNSASLFARIVRSYDTERSALKVLFLIFRRLFLFFFFFFVGCSVQELLSPFPPSLLRDSPSGSTCKGHAPCLPPLPDSRWLALGPGCFVSLALIFRFPRPFVYRERSPPGLSPSLRSVTCFSNVPYSLTGLSCRFRAGADFLICLAVCSGLDVPFLW